MNSNKYRIFYILKILIKYTDDTHFLSANNLIEKLKEEYGFKDINRKTIYRDIEAISEIISEIDTNSGYSINPVFSLSEIKIIEDMISDFKDLDDKRRHNLINKIRSFTSVYNQNLLDKIQTEYPSSTKNTLYLIDSILYAISCEETVIISFKDRKEEIIPYLLDYNNSHYYMYYSYGPDGKIYHIRLDRISSISMTTKKHNSKMRIDESRKIISESVESFNSRDIEEVKIEIIRNKEFIVNHMQDNFENVIINENTDITYAYIKVGISSVFFAKLTIYKNDIRIIAPLRVKAEYIEFLKSIINTV